MRLFLLLTACLPAALAMRPKLEEDTWWHLAVGRWVIDHRTVPQVDPFTRIGVEQGQPWVAYSWLYEVLLEGVYQLGGLTAVHLFGVLLSAAVIGVVTWFIWRRIDEPLTCLIVTALMMVVMTPFMNERPWHFTILFTILIIDAIERIRGGMSPWKAAWLPVIFALWANIHIQFVLGLGVLGIACITSLIERRHRSAFMLLTAICTLATLINPYHIQLWAVIREYATETTALRVVTELRPPDMRMPWNWAAALLVVWAIIQLIRQRRWDTWTVLLLASGIFFGARMQRDIWFATVAAVVALRQTTPSVGPASCRSIILPVTGAFLIMLTCWQAGLLWDGRSVAEAQAEHYPVAAAEHVKAHALPGPLFNAFNWGGYLIWALPDHPVAIDGRTNLHGEAHIRRSLRTWELIDWQADPLLQSSRLVIAKKGRPLTDELRRRDEWRVEYEDEIAIVFRKE